MFTRFSSPVMVASTVSPAPELYAANAASTLDCCAVVNAVLPYTGVGGAAAGASKLYQAPDTG